MAAGESITNNLTPNGVPPYNTPTENTGEPVPADVKPQQMKPDVYHGTIPQYRPFERTGVEQVIAPDTDCDLGIA